MRAVAAAGAGHGSVKDARIVAFDQIFKNLSATLLRVLGWTICLALLAFPGIPALAEAPIGGADAPELNFAIHRWLQNDEEVALTAFAALAQGGNQAAQLLLAVIDKTPALQGPWLAHLSREDRIAVLRQPGGLSGRSWLHALADQPHGAAWLALMKPDTGPEVIAAFDALGEARAAREALVILASREDPRLHQIDPAGVDPALIYLLWRGADDARRAELLDHVAPDSPQRRLMDGTLDTARLEEWLAGSDLGAPLDAVCSEFCAGSRAACLSGGYMALASHNALLTLGSPAEALIPQAQFLSEPRGRSSVLRRMLQTHDARGRRALIGQLREHDACLADVLDAEAALYRYRRPGRDGGNDG
jgi:hypothetical protein